MNCNKSYPKEFKNDKMFIEKKKCFFIMPFAEEFDLVYGTLQESLLNKGYLPVRVDYISGSTSIMSKIMIEILTSQYVIVDISCLNPNVFYELGITHCYKEAWNTILIKDKTTIAPSDIRHINYIEYDKKNLILLKEKVINTLEDIKYLSELESTLNFHKITSPKDDNEDTIIELLENAFTREELILLCRILNKEYALDDVNQIEKFIDKYIDIIPQMLEKGFEVRQIDVITLLLVKLLIGCSECNFISAKINELLYTHEVFSKPMDAVKFRTTIALNFAKEGKLINIVMPWIIEYFSQSKSTHIDLNRYSIEALLLSTTNTEINNAIMNAVFASDRHIREHMADIIGEKHMREARSNLVIQLNRETNLYTAASLMEAIGKVGEIEDIHIILKWIELNYNSINNPGGNFVFKHARNAISILDCSENNIYVKQFIRKYQKDFPFSK